MAPGGGVPPQREGLAVRAVPAWAAALAVAVWLAAGPGYARGGGADGRFEKRTSSHFVLYQDVDIDESHGLRGSRRFESRVLEVLEASYRQLDHWLGLRPGRPIDTVVHDAGLFDAQFAGRFRFPAAGFYSGTIHIRGSARVGEPLVRVLHHELVHAAFDAALPSLVLPAWLNEGLAEWFEARSGGKRRLAVGELEALRDARQSGALLGLREMGRPSFGGMGPRTAGLAYRESYALFAYLAHHHGERALRELCLEIQRTGQITRAFERTFRAPPDVLFQRFAAELGAG